LFILVGTLLKRAIQDEKLFEDVKTYDDLWMKLMLTPLDYGKGPLFDKETRKLMEKIGFEHGGKDYDDRYPDGIPTSLVVTLRDGKHMETDIVMYPPGHARNTTSDLKNILKYKFGIMGRLALDQKDLDDLLARLDKIESMSSEDLMNIYSCTIKMAPECID
jgi:2-methylcitrate dehydratase